jgi:hypothetical protein
LADRFKPYAVFNLKTETMNTRLPGKLLQKKLMELNSALFFAEGEALIKLPNHLVTEMDIKETGEIIFLIPRPAQDINAFEKEFPVRLDFFKKGKPFRLKVQGKGALITDATEVERRCYDAKQLMRKAGDESFIMIRVTVQYIDYTGNISDSLPGRIKMAGMQLSEWLFAGSSSNVLVAD